MKVKLAVQVRDSYNEKHTFHLVILVVVIIVVITITRQLQCSWDFDFLLKFGLESPQIKTVHTVASFAQYQYKLCNWQVLSNSVANALELKKCEEYESTIEFIRKLNKAFDILNVKTSGESMNVDKRPLTSPEDPRLKV